MNVKIALTGNPNCGKTTLFNVLTGSNQSVGNWPGVTVEKKEGILKGHPDVVIQDLPGIYSLSPYSPEEVVARTCLVRDPPDVVLNIVDGTNIERNLYLTTQLMELGLPVVVAVNMIDLVRKRGDSIDLEKLGNGLGCPCLQISALRGEGCRSAAEEALKLARSPVRREPVCVFSERVEEALDRIENAIAGKAEGASLRWYSVKLFERDERVRAEAGLSEELLRRLETDIRACEQELDDDAESIIADQRYTYIVNLVGKAVNRRSSVRAMVISDRIDRIVTNRILALPVFVCILFLVFAIAMGNYPFSVGTIAADWTSNVLFGTWIFRFLDGILTSLRVSDWLHDLVMNGILAGVGSVLGFVPQILVLSLMLSLLEDVGYLSRVAFILDRVFRRFGLSGKSVIPMLVASGCGVPGILSSRTIEQEQARKITIMTTCFIPCGAKMPIISLFAGAVFGNSPLVAVTMFLMGFGSVLLSGIILKKFSWFSGKPASFVLELPAYHLPSVRNVLRSAGERGLDYVRRAFTVVLLSSILLWFLQSYGFVDGVFCPVRDNSMSLLAGIGKAAAWIFYPLGWMGDMAWKAAVATFTGLIAKEQVVMTFGTLYHYAGELSKTGDELWTVIAADFGPARAYSFLAFNLLCAPCCAAIGAIRREMNSRRWTAAAVGYMCGFAYAVSLIVYQLGGLITDETAFGAGTMAAFAVLGGGICLILRDFSAASLVGKERGIQVSEAEK